MIESKGNSSLVVRVASHTYRLPSAMSWLTVSLANTDGSDAAGGAYECYVRF